MVIERGQMAFNGNLVGLNLSHGQYIVIVVK